VRIHVTTMSRALALIKARRGRPRPTVACPWAPAAKTRRLNAIQNLLATLPRRQVAVYEDEVDIHLNPKIGLDWMGYSGPRKLDHLLSYRLDQERGEQWQVSGRHTLRGSRPKSPWLHSRAIGRSTSWPVSSASTRR